MLNEKNYLPFFDFTFLIGLKVIRAKWLDTINSYTSDSIQNQA